MDQSEFKTNERAWLARLRLAYLEGVGVALVHAEIPDVLHEIVGAHRAAFPHPLVHHPRYAALPGFAQRRQLTVERPPALLRRLCRGGLSRGRCGLRHRFGGRGEEAAEQEASASEGNWWRHGFRVLSEMEK
jgi:hypothetical protein